MKGFKKFKISLFLKVTVLTDFEVGAERTSQKSMQKHVTFLRFKNKLTFRQNYSFRFKQIYVSTGCIYRYVVQFKMASKSNTAALVAGITSSVGVTFVGAFKVIRYCICEF